MSPSEIDYAVCAVFAVLMLAGAIWIVGSGTAATAAGMLGLAVVSFMFGIARMADR